MLRLSTFCTFLALTAAQNGYDYNRPNNPFGQGSTTSHPGLPSPIGTTTPYPIRPQSDDYSPTAGYSTPPPNYQATSQRSRYPDSSYPSHGSNGPSGPGSYPSGPGGLHSGPGGYPGGPGDYPGQSNYPQGPQRPLSNYPGQSDSPYPQVPHGQLNYPQSPQRPPSNYPGQSDAPYPQGPHGPSDFSGQGSRYPGQGQNYPGQSGSNFGNVGFAEESGQYVGGDYSAIPGEPDIDYPILSYIPRTNFNCKAQQYPGYYADVETRCQVFHICANNRTYDFLCPNGTVFSQEDFVCVWWNQFDCGSAPGLFELNAKIYDYSGRGSPNSPVSSFNDYSGPNYNGGRRPEGSSYPGSSGNQGPTTPYPSIPLTSSFPVTRGPSGYPGSSGNYPTTQGPGYPASQGPSRNHPNYQSSGIYPQRQSNGPDVPASGYPGTTPYPGTSSASQGYPQSRPSGPSFSNSTGGKQPQKPNREYLPPRNKRARASKH